jgi:hypothetical protein
MADGSLLPSTLVLRLVVWLSDNTGTTGLISKPGVPAGLYNLTGFVSLSSNIERDTLHTIHLTISYIYLCDRSKHPLSTITQYRPVIMFNKSLYAYQLEEFKALLCDNRVSGIANRARSLGSDVSTLFSRLRSFRQLFLTYLSSLFVPLHGREMLWLTKFG